MKHVYIIHGWDGNTEVPVLDWLKQSLSAKGYQVIFPNMPKPEVPVIKAWLNKIKEIAGQPDKDSIFIGHSVGCQAVLRYLETLPESTNVGKVVLIAPWMALDMKTIEEEGEEVIEVAKPWMETPIDFAKVKKIAPDVVAIFSDNDQYVPLSQKDLFKRELNAKIIVEHAQGHFDPANGVMQLPSALETIVG